MTCDVTVMKLMVSQLDDGGQKGPVWTQRPLSIPQMIYALEKRKDEKSWNNVTGASLMTVKRHQLISQQFVFPTL